MANQPEDFRFNLQLFAEGGEPSEATPAEEEAFDPFDNLSLDSDEEEPVEDGPENPDNPEDKPAEGEEEFDEITYNQQTVKIPKSERQTLLQKGYNYDKVHGRLTETEAALRARDVEVSRRFGQQGIHTWDDLVKGWDNVQQVQQQQQIQAFDQQTTATIRQMQEEGYESFQIQMFADQRTLLRQNMELSQRINNFETGREQQREQATTEQQVEALAKQITSDHEALKKDYGQLVPDLDKLDDATLNDVLRGMPLRKAFIANNHEAILKHQQEMAEKRTVANISDRAKRGTETKTNTPPEAPQLSKNQQALAKIFNVPASEVAKRIKK